MSRKFAVDMALLDVTEKETITESFLNVVLVVFTLNSLYQHLKLVKENTTNPSSCDPTWCLRSCCRANT